VTSRHTTVATIEPNCTMLRNREAYTPADSWLYQQPPKPLLRMLCPPSPSPTQTGAISHQPDGPGAPRF